MDETTREEIGTEDVASATEVVRSEGDQAMLSAQPRQLQQFFIERFAAAINDPAVVQRSIVENILGTDAEDVLDMAESLDSASTVKGRPLMFTGDFTVLPSEYGGIYLACDIVMVDEGEKKTINIGSPTILAQLAVIVAQDEKRKAAGEASVFPYECKIAPIRRGPKRGRNAPLYLRRLTY